MLKILHSDSKTVKCFSLIELILLEISSLVHDIIFNGTLYANHYDWHLHIVKSYKRKDNVK